MKALIIIYTKAGFSYGFGHLNRSINLAVYLDRYRVRFLLGGDEKAGLILRDRSISFDIVRDEEEFFLYIGRYEPALLIVDARDNTISFMRRALSFSKVLSLDDFGDASFLSTITVNALPRPSDISLPRANFEGIKYLVLSDTLVRYKEEYQKREYKKGEYKKGKDVPILLISFGGEDPYNLSSFTYDILCSIKEELPFKIKIVLGPLYRGNDNFRDIFLVRSLSYEDFCRELVACDIVLTSFGMTVYEALFLGKRVFTLNPGIYHNNLASSCDGIVNIGIADRKAKKLIRDRLLVSFADFLKGGKRGYRRVGAVMSVGSELLSIIDKVLLWEQARCPICKEFPYVYLRDAWINYYYCESCFSFFRGSSYSYRGEYRDDYFTGQYEAQYGRSYLEDKPAIDILNSARLKVISSIIFSRGSSLLSVGGVCGKIRILELGSAMGFFLEEARRCGFDSYGVEISSYAVSYARSELSLRVVEGNFSELSYEGLSFGLGDGGGVYDIISAWYFIEHNRDFVEVLKKMRFLLKEGGLLCLSTPNCRGISFLNDREGYIKKIPSDHYIEFSPRSLSILLSSLGFRVCKVVMGGLHFERVVRSGWLRIIFSFLRRQVLWFYGRRRLGDTFEIYARKESSNEGDEQWGEQINK